MFAPATERPDRARAPRPQKVKVFKIYRWNPDEANQKPTLASYSVNMDEYVNQPHFVPASERPPRPRVASIAPRGEGR